MTDEPNLNVSVELDLNGADRALDEAPRTRPDAFGGALSGALKSATVDGRNLDDVLRTLGNRMVGIALDAGVKPLEQLISNTITGLSGQPGPGAAVRKWRVPGRVTPFADGGVVVGPILFSDCWRRCRTDGGSGRRGDPALERGPDGRLGVGGGRQVARAVYVTFNVRRRMPRVFPNPEAQITAMLARRGRARPGAGFWEPAAHDQRFFTRFGFR